MNVDDIKKKSEEKSEEIEKPEYATVIDGEKENEALEIEEEMKEM